MPSVTRQKRTKTGSKSSGVLGRIVPVDSLTKGMKLLVYGRGKTGKTRLFSTFPKPALLIGTEDGTNSVADEEDLDFVRLNNTQDLDDLSEYLKEGKYKSVGLDTAGGFQDIVMREVLGLEDMPIQKSWGIARKQDWGTGGSRLKEHLSKLFNLADQSICDVMIIAHERNFVNEDDPNEVLSPTVGAALTPTATAWLNGTADYVCQTFVREETVEIKKKVANKTITQIRKTGKMEYCLRVGPHPVFLTGFRVRRKIQELPQWIVDPSYDRIVELIEGPA